MEQVYILKRKIWDDFDGDGVYENVAAFSSEQEAWQCAVKHEMVYTIVEPIDFIQ